MVLSTQSQLHANFDDIQKIGQGAYGKVVRAKSKTDKKDYAIKIIAINEDVRVEREIHTLKNLDHKNVIKYITSWYENENVFFTDDSSSEGSATTSLSKSDQSCGRIVCIQMELCQSTLRKKMESKLNKYEVYHFFKQMCEGLKHIHSKSIIHRDLKPENIFIANEHHVKIGDFGLSRIWNSFHLQPQSYDNNSDSITCYVGTKIYSAPETEKAHYKYNQKADIYSLGIIYFEMCYGPFLTAMERFELMGKIRQSTIELPNDIDNDYVYLIRLMLGHNPKKRPTTKMILDLLPPSVDDLRQFFKQIDITRVPKKKASTYLRMMTRQESTDEKQFWQNKIILGSEGLSQFVADLRKKLENYGARLFIVPLFLPRTQEHLNTSTDLCLMNDRSLNVYAIPSDRRLCFIEYLKNVRVREALPYCKKRYAIDTVFDGDRFGTYNETMECNFDEIDYIPNDFLVRKHILFQLDYIESNILNLKPLVILVNHRSLYNEIMLQFKISKTDQQTMENILLKSGIKQATLSWSLRNKTTIAPQTVAEICEIFCGKTDKLFQRPEFKIHQDKINTFIYELQKEMQTDCEIQIKPLMCPHLYSRGIVYEIQHWGGQISKGSEYMVDSTYPRCFGAGFSLNITNVAKHPRAMSKFSIQHLSDDLGLVSLKHNQCLF